MDTRSLAVQGEIESVAPAVREAKEGDGGGDLGRAMNCTATQITSLIASEMNTA